MNESYKTLFIIYGCYTLIISLSIYCLGISNYSILTVAFIIAAIFNMLAITLFVSAIKKDLIYYKQFALDYRILVILSISAFFLAFDSQQIFLDLLGLLLISSTTIYFMYRCR